MSRRTFLAAMGVAGAALAGYTLAERKAFAEEAAPPVSVGEVTPGEDVFAYITRIKGSFDQKLYQQVIGAANNFKEGDVTIGVGAKDAATRQKMKEVEGRGVDLATGHGKNIWDLNPQLEAKIKALYADAKKSLWTELNPDFVKTIPGALPAETLSKDRNDYIAHPETGEKLRPDSIAALEKLKNSRGTDIPKGQIVISDDTAEDEAKKTRKEVIFCGTMEPAFIWQRGSKDQENFSDDDGRRLMQMNSTDIERVTNAEEAFPATKKWKGRSEGMHEDE